MPGIETEQLFILERISQIELVRANDIALRADAEQFALDGIQLACRVELFGKEFIQRFSKSFSRACTIHRHVLIPIGHPDICHAGAAQCAAHLLANPTADYSVLDPELADAFVRAGEGEPVLSHGVREEGAIEVQTGHMALGPLDPTRELLHCEFVALYFLAAGLGIDRMKVQAMLAGNEAQRFFEIHSQLIGGAGLAGIIPRCLNPPAGEFAGFIPAHVIALPAVERHGNAGQHRNRSVRVYANRGVLFPRMSVGVFNCFLCWHIAYSSSFESLCTASASHPTVRAWLDDTWRCPPSCA